MDMQREDFLALCKGPVNGGKYFYDTMVAGQNRKGFGLTHSGAGSANQLRVLNDWFPAGEIFTFLGVNCMSRGALPKENGFGVHLEVLAHNPDGGYQTYRFSVREALSIAQQCSVDTINWLDSLNRDTA